MSLDNIDEYFQPLSLDGLAGNISQTIATNALLVDGTNQMLADLDAGNHNVKNVASPADQYDAVNLLYLDAELTALDSIVLHRANNLTETANGLKTFSSLLTASAGLNAAGVTTTAGVNCSNTKVSNLANPTSISSYDAVSANYVLNTYITIADPNTVTGAKIWAALQMFDLQTGVSGIDPCVWMGQVNQRVNFIPSATAGAYNSLTSAGDSLIYTSGSAINSSNLVLCTHSSTKSGLRVTPTTVEAWPKLGVNAQPNSNYALDVAGYGRCSTRFGVGQTGNTVPAYPLDITGQARITTQVGINGYTPQAGVGLTVGGGIQVPNAGSLFLADGDATLASAGDKLVLYTDPDALSVGLGCALLTDATTGGTRIRSRVPSASDGIQFHMGYSGDGITTTAEKMRLTASGRLGIGTTSPQSRLHVTDTSVAQFYLQNSTYRWSMSTLSNQLRFFNDVGAAGEISFEPNAASPQLRIDGNGVGIGGAPSASQILTVNGSANISATLTANTVSGGSVTATTGNVTSNTGDIVVATVGDDGFQIGSNPTSSIGTKLFMDTTPENSTILAARSTTSTGSLDLCWNRLGDGVTGNTVRLSIANTITANGRLIMSSNRISSVADPTQDADAVNRLYADGRYVSLTATQSIGGSKTFTSAVSMSSQKIVSLADPTAAQDAATKNYVDNQVAARVAGDVIRVSFPGVTTVATTFNSGGTWTDMFTFSVNRTDTSTTLWFQIDAAWYTTRAFTNAKWIVRLYDSTGATVVNQRSVVWPTTTAGQMRNSTLFPMMAQYTPATGSRSYKVQINCANANGETFYMKEEDSAVTYTNVRLDEIKV